MFDVRLSGGLGNQLFQAATGLYLQNRFGGSLRLTDATAQYRTRRTLDLSRVLRVPHMLQTESSSMLDGVLHDLRIGRASTPLSINDNTAERVFGQTTLRRTLIAGRLPYLVDGYFQDCWSDDSLQRMLELVQSCALGCTQGDHTVVHVRGGDFLKIPKYRIADQAFYQRAFRLLESQLGDGARELAVLTDDQAYAGSLLSGCELPGSWSWRLVADGDIVHDFQLLQGAAHRVIGNSTFSWWASALGAKHSSTISTTHWTLDRAKRYRLAHETLVS